MKSNEGALRPFPAAALLLVLFREIWGWDHNPKQLNNQQRGQHRRLGNAPGAREDPKAASFRRARNAPWAALAGCIMPPNIFLKTEKLVLFCQINLDKSTAFSHPFGSNLGRAA